jgi:hypothetical protein
MREKEHIRHSHHRIYSLCNKGMILNGRIAPQKYIFEISRTCRRLLGSSHDISHVSGKYTIVQFRDLMIPRYESTTTFSVFLRVLTIPILRIFDRLQRNHSCSAPICTMLSIILVVRIEQKLVFQDWSCLDISSVVQRGLLVTTRKGDRACKTFTRTTTDVVFRALHVYLRIVLCPDIIWKKSIEESRVSWMYARDTVPFVFQRQYSNYILNFLEGMFCPP